ncbi:MAG: hypothetical protein P8L85_19845 [Rubripirellula sp.]|nr:hypothetical protein [Rubripirellula sp.]
MPVRVASALVFLISLVATPEVLAQQSESDRSAKKTLDVLFIGNSYTARHNLANVVEAMAEAGNPGLDFRPTTVIYGGRTLSDHWRLGTANFVKLHSLTSKEELATVASLKEAAKDATDRYANMALKKHHELLKTLTSKRNKWDVVVLQSYRDDLEGAKSLYAQFAPRFAELARAQGARVILYVTTPTTQNAEPLAGLPDVGPVMKKTRAIAVLANQIEASVAPMSLVAFKTQTERPDLTLRFINDGHLNKTMAYLTACTLYAALFDRTPEGLPVDSITDIRYWQRPDKSFDKTKDRDQQPIKQTFSTKDRADLQRIAWESYTEFETLRHSK